MKRILLIAGTRPNFVKLAPLYKCLQQAKQYQVFICHTGQHFDFNMSDVFWENLELPEPDFKLGVKGDGVADTIGKTILSLNDVFRENVFDLTIVFGDVNATIAGAIVAAQSGVKLMHVEAGLRSFDKTMPEEINRIVVDHVSDYLMVSEPVGVDNLRAEGIDENRYSLVGNIMIEAIIKTRDKWENARLPDALKDVLHKKYAIATFHRPENVDDRNSLSKVIEIISAIAEAYDIVFPVHPRTKARLEKYGLIDILTNNNKIILSEPLSYFDFLNAVSKAALVVTDSGGIQEETSFLNVPCVTFRKNTEWQMTVTSGTNLLLDINDAGYHEKISSHVFSINKRDRFCYELWDDKVSSRILDFINNSLTFE